MIIVAEGKDNTFQGLSIFEQLTKLHVLNLKRSNGEQQLGSVKDKKKRLQGMRVILNVNKMTCSHYNQIRYCIQNGRMATEHHMARLH